jgi:hypothetical protein
LAEAGRRFKNSIARRAKKDTVMPEKSLLSLERLSAIAQSLNQATDELTGVVGSLDEALQRLNVGLVVWVYVEKWNSEDGLYYECEQVGYAKVEGQWGIAIRKVAGREDSSDGEEVRSVWAFNDAPRDARLRAVEKLPQVVDELGKVAAKTTEILNRKLAVTKEYAAAIGILNPDGSKKQGAVAKEKK